MGILSFTVFTAYFLFSIYTNFVYHLSFAWGLFTWFAFVGLVNSIYLPASDRVL